MAKKIKALKKRKKNPVLGVDYGTGTKMFGPHRKRGRKPKVHYEEGSYSLLSDRGVYVHKGGVKRFKGRKLKKHKSHGPTTKKGFPLDLFKRNLGKMIRKAKDNGIAIPR